MKSRGCLAHNQSSVAVLVSGVIGGLGQQKKGWRLSVSLRKQKETEGTD